MDKTSIMALFVVAFLIVSCDVTTGLRKCSTTEDCTSHEDMFPKCVCVDGTCVCSSLNTHSLDHEEGGSSGKY
ncbi:hypothetical protein H5410_025150 [Solanum commersonii]|uniref:Uncharacterized protein n=1 Tax=Solanum commersonii TaxID=4109 RepID=A0A9J5YTF9_SOLCO|nr:hypothetical protein H5410_025150 [Solanum commersonii]